jgi:Fe2+ transport system protein FeoA
MSMMDDHSVSHNNYLPAAQPWYALSDMSPGSHAVVRDLHGDTYFVTMLAARGLTAETELSVLRNSGHGALLIVVRDTCLALGRSEAAWVEVEPITAEDRRTRSQG